MISGKAWGYVSQIHTDPFGVDYLTIHRGGFSSKHCHQHKFNKFHVISGRLLIRQWVDDRIDETVLIEGQTLIIPPTLWHQFEALCDCQVIEVMWTSGIDENDIQRIGHGGKEETYAKPKEAAGI
jgi:mannose-6-phosphate isomerase-like protein (cupin superfamily)